MDYPISEVQDEISRLLDLVPDHGKGTIQKEIIDYIEEIVLDERKALKDELEEGSEEELKELEENLQIKFDEQKEDEKEYQAMLKSFYSYT